MPSNLPNSTQPTNRNNKKNKPLNEIILDFKKATSAIKILEEVKKEQSTDDNDPVIIDKSKITDASQALFNKISEDGKITVEALNNFFVEHPEIAIEIGARVHYNEEKSTEEKPVFDIDYAERSQAMLIRKMLAASPNGIEAGKFAEKSFDKILFTLGRDDDENGKLSASEVSATYEAASTILRSAYIKAMNAAPDSEINISEKFLTDNDQNHDGKYDISELRKTLKKMLEIAEKDREEAVKPSDISHLESERIAKFIG